MREYVIMTDSCCDLTDHMAKELELTVVPLTVHIDGHDYPNLLDGSAISFEDFYGKIRGGVLATTSAANVGQFQEAMRPFWLPARTSSASTSPAPSPPPTKVRASPPKT